MKPSIYSKLQQLIERHEELSALLSDAQIVTDNQKYRDYSKEYAELEPVVEQFRHYQQAKADRATAQAMLAEDDAEMKALAADEVAAAETRIIELELELQRALVPRDPNDGRNVFLEIRAGTGGDEAAIFAGDLFRMYSRYAEKQRWKLEILSENPGEHGGYKEIISRVVGSEVYARLKFESGAHRVQRVPETESQGRIHTSACTVAVMPEPDEVEIIEINPADLKVDTFRASGAGGQHVNKTESAIRITHLPSGVVVECQDERSQHKNRARAMSILQAKLQTAEREKHQSQQDESRRNLVGSGDRSERIRTYNYPQGRVTDHRINLTLYRLEEIMEGDIQEILQALSIEHQADQLAALADGHG